MGGPGGRRRAHDILILCIFADRSQDLFAFREVYFHAEPDLAKNGPWGNSYAEAPIFNFGELRGGPCIKFPSYWAGGGAQVENVCAVNCITKPITAINRGSVHVET